MKHKKNKIEYGLEATRNSPVYRKFASIMYARVRLAVEVNEARVAKGWSQNKLAKAAKTTQKVISKIESGDTNPGFDLLNRIAVCLELPLQVGRVSFVDSAVLAEGLLGVKKHGVPA